MKDSELKHLIPLGAEVIELDPDEIVTVKDTHDREDYGDVEALADSIKTEGQIQPILITKLANGKGGHHNVIIAGRRRRLACKYLGIKVKCIVVNPTDKAHLLDIQLAENVFRKDFDLLELAEALMLRKQHYDAASKEEEKGRPRFVDAMAKRLEVSPDTIKRLMFPATLPEPVKQEIKKTGITPAQRNILVRDVIKEIKLDKKRAELEQRKIKRYKPRTKAIISAKWSLHHGMPQDLLKDHVKENSVDLVFTYHREGLSHNWLEAVKPYLSARGQIVILCDDLEDVARYRDVFRTMGLVVQEGLHVCLEDMPHPPRKHKNYYHAMIYMARATVHERFYYNADHQKNYSFYRRADLPEELGFAAKNPPAIFVRDMLREMAATHHIVLDPFANMGTILYETILHRREVIAFECDALLYKFCRKRLKRMLEGTSQRVQEALGAKNEAEVSSDGDGE